MSIVSSSNLIIFFCLRGGSFFSSATILHGRLTGGRDFEGIMHLSLFLELKIEFERMCYLSKLSTLFLNSDMLLATSVCMLLRTGSSSSPALNRISTFLSGQMRFYTLFCLRIPLSLFIEEPNKEYSKSSKINF